MTQIKIFKNYIPASEEQVPFQLQATVSGKISSVYVRSNIETYIAQKKVQH